MDEEQSGKQLSISSAETFKIKRKNSRRYAGEVKEFCPDEIKIRFTKGCFIFLCLCDRVSSWLTDSEEDFQAGGSAPVYSMRALQAYSLGRRPKKKGEIRKKRLTQRDKFGNIIKLSESRGDGKEGHLQEQGAKKRH